MHLLTEIAPLLICQIQILIRFSLFKTGKSEHKSPGRICHCRTKMLLQALFVFLSVSAENAEKVNEESSDHYLYPESYQHKYHFYHRPSPYEGVDNYHTGEETDTLYGYLTSYKALGTSPSWVRRPRGSCKAIQLNMVMRYVNNNLYLGFNFPTRIVLEG